MKNQVLDPRGGVAVRVSEGDIARALGFHGWTYDPSLITTATAPTAGTRYAMALYLKKGQVVSNVCFNVAAAGAGTVPTSIFVGISDDRVMRAVSSDLKASAIWTTATSVAVAPLSATWEVPSSGLYYVEFLQVGAWGTTQMTLNRCAGAPTVGMTLAQATFGTSQTVLPAALAAVTLVSTSGLRYWGAAS